MGGPSLRLSVLGPVHLQADGDEVPLRGSRLRALVAVLGTSRSRPVRRDRLVEAIWEADQPAIPHAALHTLVSRLRSEIGSDVLVSDDEGYRLLLSQPSDAEDFERLCEEAGSATAEEAAVQLRNALSLWRGDAFGELSALFALRPDAERLDNLRSQAMERLGELLVQLGRAEEALGVLAAVVTRHPLRERAALLYTSALYAAGRPVEALNHLRGYRATVRDELGLDPTPEFEALERRLLRHELRAAVDARPAAPAPLRPRVPSWRPSRTAFVGRDDEILALEQMVREHSIVTVIGPGGVGKTRLVAEALEALAATVGRSPVVVELARVRPEDAELTVAAAFGIQGGRESLRQGIVDYLGGEEVLLVLDGCEHLVETLRPLLGELVRWCATVSLVTTSRRRFELGVERVLPIGPLRPPPGGPDPAVALFVDRVRQLRPDFGLDEESRDAVASICHRLDALPLAVELAATRAATLGVDQVAADADVLSLLDWHDEFVDDPEPRTLSATIAWSFDLLAPEDQRLLAELSVIEGAFDMAAAAALTPERDRSALARGIGHCVEASLLAADHRGGGVSYRLLDLVRAFLVRRRSALLPDHDLRRRHAHWVLDRVGEVAAGTATSHDAAAYAELGARKADLAEAVRWSRSHDSAIAGRLAVQLALACTYRSDVDVLVLVDRLAENRDDTASDVRAAAAHAAVMQGNAGRGVAEARRVLAGTGRAVGWETLYLAEHAVMVGSLYLGELRASEEACHRGLLVPGLPAARKVEFHATLALLGGYRGDHRAAIRGVEVARAVAEATGSGARRAFALYVQGEVRLLGSDEAASTAPGLLREAVRVAEQTGTPFVAGLARTTLLSALVRRGEYAGAAALLGEVLRHWRRAGSWPQLWTTARLGAELLVATDRPWLALLVLRSAERDPRAPAATGADRSRLDQLEEHIRARLDEAELVQVETLASALPAPSVLDRITAESADIAAEAPPRERSF